VPSAIIHDGEQYRVVHHRVSDSPNVVINFDWWQPAPSREAPSPTADFFVKRRINFISVKPARNDWFQDDEILQAIAAIRTATPGARRIGYGGSMGGYAVINFAADLGLDTMISVCPQFSIDRAKVPFEQRWEPEAASITFRHDRIADIPPIPRGFVLFDPTNVDAKHWHLIARFHNLTPLGIYFAGHHQLAFLNQVGLTAPMLLSIIDNSFDRAAFLRRVRAVRARSNIIWLGAAIGLVRRRAFEPAMQAMRRARQGPLPDPFEADVLEAEILVELGRPAEAADFMTDHLQNPVMMPLAKWHSARIGLLSKQPERADECNQDSMPDPHHNQPSAHPADSETSPFTPSL
jgi:hypothetical protein